MEAPTSTRGAGEAGLLPRRGAGEEEGGGALPGAASATRTQRLLEVTQQAPFESVIPAIIAQILGGDVNFSVV